MRELGEFTEIDSWVSYWDDVHCLEPHLMSMLGGEGLADSHGGKGHCN